MQLHFTVGGRSWTDERVVEVCVVKVKAGAGRCCLRFTPSTGSPTYTELQHRFGFISELRFADSQRPSANHPACLS